MDSMTNSVQNVYVIHNNLGNEVYYQIRVLVESNEVKGKLYANELPLGIGNEQQLRTLIKLVKGNPVDDFRQTLDSSTFLDAGQLERVVRGTESRLMFKSLILIYEWVHPYFRSLEISKIRSRLTDEVLIDYSASLGAQDYLYFVSQDHPIDALERLFVKDVLRKFKYDGPNNEWVNYFISLGHIPEPIGLDDRMKDVWDEIKFDLSDALEEIAQ